MRGFDPEFVDLPDYIAKITDRIWEGRGIGLIRRWYAYAADCIVHTTHSNVVDGRIRDEWIVADEIAVRKQIALTRG